MVYSERIDKYNEMFFHEVIVWINEFDSPSLLIFFIINY